MVKAVFTLKPDSGYLDVPEERYHFTATYLRAVSAARDDWILYYSPRRGGNQCYFAVARVRDVVPDRQRQGHYNALMSDDLDFVSAVSFRAGQGTWEPGLTKADGSINKSAFGRSVRPLEDAVFWAILNQAFRVPE